MNFLLRAASTGIKLCSQLHFCQSHQTAKETRMHAWVLLLQLWTALMNHVPQRPLGHRQPSSDPLGTCTCAHMPVLLWAAHGISTSNEAWSPIWETGREKKVMVWFGVWHHCQGDGGCLVLSWFLASGLGVLQMKGTPGQMGTHRTVSRGHSCRKHSWNQTCLTGMLHLCRDWGYRETCSNSNCCVFQGRS